MQLLYCIFKPEMTNSHNQRPIFHPIPKSHPIFNVTCISFCILPVLLLPLLSCSPPNFTVWQSLRYIYVQQVPGVTLPPLTDVFCAPRPPDRHNLKSDVRESLYEACDTWTRELRKRGTPFLGGERPNLADVSVYGVLSSIGERRM